MPRFVWTQNYRSGLAVGVKGERVDVSDELAAAIARDAPGSLAPVDDKPKADARALDAPPADRMVHKASKRGHG